MSISSRFQPAHARARDPRRDVRSVNNKPGVKKASDNKSKAHDDKRVNNEVNYWLSSSILLNDNLGQKISTDCWRERFSRRFRT